MTRGHEGNKAINFWIPTEKFEQLEEFLEKFSTGDSFSIDRTTGTEKEDT